MGGESQNGWNEYSRLVLKELESLADGIDSVKTELQEVKQEIAKIQAREDKVEELRVWRDRLDEIVSPSQLRELILTVEQLKTFRTKAITIFAVVQFGMAAAMWLINMTG